MWYIFIIIISTAGIIFGAYSCNFKNSKTSILGNDISPDDTIKGSCKRSAIKEKLEVLAKTPAPTDLKQGAMCYTVVNTSDSTYYSCPKCGEKTLYTKNAGRFVQRELPGCRSMANTLSEINLTLDESQYCKKCSPDIVSPQLCMTYKLSDDTSETNICGIDSDDLEIMKEFLQGTEKHEAGQGREVPLKDYLPRLQQLFGIKIESEIK
jgi:hypothetical protein